MKFALIGPTIPYRGGISQYNSCLYRALAGRGLESLLISFSRQYPASFFPGTTQEDTSKAPFDVPSKAMLDSLRPASWRRVGRRLADYDPTAIVCQWWQPFFAPAYLGVLREARRKRHIPALFLCHNILSHEKVPVPGRRICERILTSQAFRKADGFLVHADEMVPALKRLNPHGLVRKIYHPLYDFYLQWDSNRREKTDPGTASLLFFGKVRKYKGLMTFLEALAILKNQMAFRAVIAGEFYVSQRSYRAASQRWGLEGSLIWKDHYIANEEVPGLFRDADLVVLPYREATQSGVVPVAYQFEVPVVASDVGGLSEVVLDDRTGYLFPPGDASALAERMFRFFSTARSEQFRNNIREFRQRLTWDQVVDTVLELSGALTPSGR